MRKCYAIADFLSEENKRVMRGTAEECGFEISFFESAAEASGHIADGEVIYCDGSEALREMPDLKWCHSAFAGAGGFIASGIFDSEGVTLTNSSGAYGLTISEHIIMVTLMLMRRMPDYFKIIEERRWIQDLPVRSIEGSVIAVIGTGDIGQNAAKRYKALGAKKVIGFSRGGRPREFFDEVHKMDEYGAVISSEEPDVLLSCIPGTPDTEGIISREYIDMLPEKALFINVGRGRVVDQEALTEALEEDRIAGAALDVMYPEPLPADHPLWETKNCIVTPHISGDMGLPHTVDVTVGIFCDNLKRYVSGEELTHVVDIKAGY